MTGSSRLEATAGPVVECRQLVRLYRAGSGSVQAVRGADLEIEAGRVTIVRGPSGSGKSTLLRMIAGLVRPSAGYVAVCGVELHALRPRRRARVRAALLTHVEQQPSANLYAHLTAREQLTRLATTSDGPDEALELVGLQTRRDHFPSEMSGGERQRLAISRSLVAHHPLVIADEPTSQLDRDAAAATIDALQSLSRRGTAVVIATHDPRVIERADEEITLRDGAIASVKAGGTKLSVIDRSGRLQLPPEVLNAYFERRAVLSFDPESGTVEIRRP